MPRRGSHRVVLEVREPNPVELLIERWRRLGGAHRATARGCAELASAAYERGQAIAREQAAAELEALLQAHAEGM